MSSNGLHLGEVDNPLTLLANVAAFAPNTKDEETAIKKWDKRTGRPCINPLEEGSHVVNYRWIQNNWPYDSKTGKKLEWGTEGSHVKSYQWINNHWPYDRRTGEKLEWGETGPNIITYRDRLKLKSRLIYARDVLGDKGELIHKKGEPIASKTRVKKWGPGTPYETGPKIEKPRKRKNAKKTPKQTRRATATAPKTTTAGSYGTFFSSQNKSDKSSEAPESLSSASTSPAVKIEIIQGKGLSYHGPDARAAFAPDIKDEEKAIKKWDKRTGKPCINPLDTGSHVVNYCWVQKNWPYDRRTGEKLEWGETNSNIMRYPERRKLKSRLIYARDVFDDSGEQIHKKGAPLEPRIRVKKWGPGTKYKVAPERPKPAKRKRTTTKETGSTRPRKTARTESKGLSQERNRLFTHGQTDTTSNMGLEIRQDIRLNMSD